MHLTTRWCNTLVYDAVKAL